MDRRVWWNRETKLAVIVEMTAAFNIDIYAASLPIWMVMHNYELLAGTVIVTAMVSRLTGNVVAGYVVDRLGIKKAQMTALAVVLVVAVATSFENSTLILIAELIRYGACEVVLLANRVQLRGLLSKKISEEREIIKGLSRLWTLGFASATTGVAAGPLLLVALPTVWRWVAPTITVVGIMACLLSKSVQQGGLEKATLIPNLQILKVAIPNFGLAACLGAIYGYLILDIGVELGALARSTLYIAAGVAGWYNPYLIKLRGEKVFILTGVLLMSVSVLLFYRPSLVGVVVAAVAIGTVNGGVTVILGNKALQMVEVQKGRAAATEQLISSSGSIAGSIGFGVLRPHYGMEAWLLLTPALGLVLVGFLWSFRYWKEKT